MRTEVTNIKTHITKAKNQEATHVWYSCNSMTDHEVKLLKEYFKESKYAIALFVRSIPASRPQRTWGTMPYWFRPASASNSYLSCTDSKGDFIFVWFPTEQEALDTFKEETVTSLKLFEELFVWFNGEAQTILGES